MITVSCFSKTEKKSDSVAWIYVSFCFWLSSGKKITVYVVVFGCLLLIHLDKALFLSDSKNYDMLR